MILNHHSFTNDIYFISIFTKYLTLNIFKASLKWLKQELLIVCKCLPYKFVSFYYFPPNHLILNNQYIII